MNYRDYLNSLDGRSVEKENIFRQAVQETKKKYGEYLGINTENKDLRQINKEVSTITEMNNYNTTIEYITNLYNNIENIL